MNLFRKSSGRHAELVEASLPLRLPCSTEAVEMLRQAQHDGQRYCDDFLNRFGIWCTQLRALGEVFDSNSGFTLPDGSVLSSDASWVSADKWNALTTEQQDKFAPVCPEFVVELKLATDSTKTCKPKC